MESAEGRALWSEASARLEGARLKCDGPATIFTNGWAFAAAFGGWLQKRAKIAPSGPMEGDRGNL
jgi:hypothetical protein